MKYVPYSVIINDMKMAFCGQVKNRIKQQEFGSDEHQNPELGDLENFRMAGWKMTSVFDERNASSDYQEKLELREGKTAERLYREKKVTEEKKMDRGYDIVRTWDI